MRTSSDFCPLCGTELAPGQNSSSKPPAPNSYPDLAKNIARYNLIKRILMFVSLLGCGICLMVNLLVTPGFLWCLIVIASVIYCWLAIPPLLRRGTNFAARIVLNIALTSLLTIMLDIIIGYSGWSVSYVLPSLLSAGILATALMALINRTNWAQIVLYQVLVGIFGFIPLLLYVLGIASNLVMVIITAALALASLLVTLLFGDRSIKSEFKRRFHF